MSAPAESTEIVHPYVETRPDVQGGRPVIRGTRFPISSVIQNYRRGLSVDELLREFPDLSPAQVHDALSYYYDHRAHIDREIAQMKEWEQISATYPPTLHPGNGSG